MLDLNWYFILDKNLSNFIVRENLHNYICLRFLGFHLKRFDFGMIMPLAWQDESRLARHALGVKGVTLKRDHFDIKKIDCKVNRWILIDIKSMGYFVYILYSKKRSRYYVGQTNSIENRIKRHNQGTVTSTKGGLPWELIFAIEVENRSAAMMLENKIKKRGIKRFLEDIHFGM